jgi:hypothetical protein
MPGSIEGTKLRKGYTQSSAKPIGRAMRKRCQPRVRRKRCSFERGSELVGKLRVSGLGWSRMVSVTLDVYTRHINALADTDTDLAFRIFRWTRSKDRVGLKEVLWSTPSGRGFAKPAMQRDISRAVAMLTRIMTQK